MPTLAHTCPQHCLSTVLHLLLYHCLINCTLPQLSIARGRRGGSGPSTPQQGGQLFSARQQRFLANVQRPHVEHIRTDGAGIDEAQLPNWRLVLAPLWRRPGTPN